MMMLALRSFFLLIFFTALSADAFVTPQSTRGCISSSGVCSPRFMFNTDDDKASPLPKAEPLKTMDEPEAAVGASVENVVKDLNTGEVKEVKWIDPAMSANQNPFDMTWWAYALFVFFPGALLLNDVAKSVSGSGFLPTDGPLGFLSQL